MKTTPAFTVGDMVRAERNRRRLTQADLAARAGLTAATIHTVETGKHEPSLGTIRKIAAALRCPIESLVPPVAA